MRNLGLCLLWASLLVAAPPVTRKSDFQETLHGTPIADPYRWLEDGSSEAVRGWIKEQNSYTSTILDPIPGREKLVQRLIDLTRYTVVGPPEKAGGRRFFDKRLPGQNQPAIWVQEADGSSRVLLDPNVLSSKGLVAVTGFSPSPDGKLLAYGLSQSGSDWQVFRVRDVATGTDLADKLEWIKASSPTWSASGDGIYYVQPPVPKEGEALTAANKGAKLRFHKLGQPQAEDGVIWEQPDQPEYRAGAWISPDGRHRLLIVFHGTRPETQILHDDLKTGKRTALIGGFFASFRPIGIRNGDVLLWTTADAPRGRLIAVPIANPAKANWKSVLPESPDAVLDRVVWGAGHLFAAYTKDAKASLRTFTLDGKPVRDIALPGLGTVLLQQNEASYDDPEQYYGFGSYLQPLTWYRYDWRTGHSEAVVKNDYAFQPERLETRLVFYNSKDGTRVPMFVSSRKGIALDGKNPVLLTGYGGFTLSVRPSYNAMAMAWMEMGGVYAHACLRGGFEYGQPWYEAGRLKNKQNVFDDFIAAAEYLIRERYTSREKLAITGGSNGGLLVGAVLNQRPDLFGAAVPRVGVMDMLRFHKFTVGKFWTSDYGDPDKPEDFAVLLKYSPLHNIRKGTQYPPTMVMTADHDDRVVPAHSFKYAAALQAAQEGKAPIFIRIEENAGHSAGKPVSKRVEEDADVLRFLRFALQLN